MNDNYYKTEDPTDLSNWNDPNGSHRGWTRVGTYSDSMLMRNPYLDITNTYAPIIRRRMILRCWEGK